jgi:hypothetical protein
MAARTIVTFHPDVACDMCGRRLLRGEQPDVFVGGGQRRTVCELCTQRATHEGWLRETEERLQGDADSGRTQRGRSLLGKLRQSRRSSSDRSARPVRAEVPPRAAEESREQGEWAGIDREWAGLTEERPAAAEWAEPDVPRPGAGVGGADLDEAWAAAGASAEPQAESSGGSIAELAGTAPAAGDDRNVREALEVFNAGTQPRRLLGVARALGAPSIRAAPVADAATVVSIVVAWELCWYRYEIDLEDEASGARLAAEGMELEELAAEDRVANAAADERGELSLLDA